MELLQTVGEAVTRLPEGFSAHRQIRKVYEHRRAMIETGGFGSYLLFVSLELFLGGVIEAPPDPQGLRAAARHDRDGWVLVLGSFLGGRGGRPAAARVWVGWSGLHAEQSTHSNPPPPFYPPLKTHISKHVFI